MILPADAFGVAEDGTPIPGLIRQSTKARRVSLIVRPDRVELVLPPRAILTGPRGALAFLESRKEWVVKTWDKVRKKAQNRVAAATVPVRFVHGSTVLHRGRQRVLNVVEADVSRPRVIEYPESASAAVVRSGGAEYPESASAAVVRSGGADNADAITVSVPRGLTDAGRERTVAITVRAWAWAGLIVEARRHALEMAGRLGMAVSDVRLTRARSRWGSCSATGVIRVNVALAATPPDLLEYLVAHEVAHLRWHNHGPRFYAALTGLLPDWQERRARLRIHEREHPLTPG